MTGTPNVGKTTLFNALTGSHNRTGNYHGVTAAVSCAKGKIEGVRVVCDLPGLYTLSNGKNEEQIAARALQNARKRSTAIVQVANACALSRSLPLFRELQRGGYRVVLAITMADKLRRSGGALDVQKLSVSLGAPCVEVDALRKKSVREFVQFLFFTDSVGKTRQKETALSTKTVFWEKENQGSRERVKTKIGENTEKLDGYALPQNYLFSERKNLAGASKTKTEKGEGKRRNIFESGFGGAAITCLFFLAIFGVFYAAFGSSSIGVWAKERIENVFITLSTCVGKRIKNSVLNNVICGGVIRGLGGVLSFLPQLAILYLFSDFLEESGIASRLAYETDGFFSLLSLSGRAAFSIFLGFGCTAAGIASSGALENKNAQRRAVACLYFVPCSAKLPVYLILLSSVLRNAFLGAVVLYALGVGIGLCVSCLCGGKEEDFIMEIADFCIPSPFLLAKKLLFRLKGFIIKVSTTVLAFTTCAYALASLNFQGACAIESSVLAWISKRFALLFYPMGVRDWRAAFAAVGGFVAKENVVGLLFALCPEGLCVSRGASAAYLTFVALMPPCVAAVAAACKEIGAAKAWKYAALQIAGAFACAYFVYFAFSSGAAMGLVCLILAAIIVYAVVFHRKKKKRKKV